MDQNPNPLRVEVIAASVEIKMCSDYSFLVCLFGSFCCQILLLLQLKLAFFKNSTCSQIDVPLGLS